MATITIPALPAHEGRQLLETLTEEIQALKSRLAVEMYNLGLRLVRIRDEELWRYGDYRTFDDYCTRGAVVSRATSYRALRLVAHFNAEIAARYGSEKLLAMLRWEAATPIEERPGDLFAADIRLRDEQGRFFRLPMHEARSTQIDEAILLINEAKRGGERIERSWLRRADAVNARLPGKSKPVKLTRLPDGELAMKCGAVRMKDLPALVQALQELLLDQED